MVSVRKRKMNRSGVGKTTRRLKDKHNKINVRGNPIIAANWDYNATLAQNYQRLGLAVKLEKAAGGAEKNFKDSDDEKESIEEEEESDEEEEEDEDVNKKGKSSKGKGQVEEEDEEDIDPRQIPVGEARIIKDADGNVKKIIHGTKAPVDAEDEDADLAPVQPKTKVVEELEAYAARPVFVQERYQSVREKDWLGALYEKYGDNYEGMKWDKKLNVFQNSSGDLKRKIKKWKKQNKIST